MTSVTVSYVASVIEAFAPLGLQEEYDNSGLLVGNPAEPVSSILVSLDVTSLVIDEAIAIGANLIVAHHPVIFNGLKRLTGSSETERVVMKAIKHGISIYCAHTNLDSTWGGVSHAMANALGLVDVNVLSPATNQLVKLITFAPVDAAEKVRAALFNAGAGSIGNYDECSFNLSGFGTFRGGENSNPFVGDKGKVHSEHELRIEVIVPKVYLKPCINTLIETHPYEEVAYDVYPLENINPRVGLGVVGEFVEPMNERDFLLLLKAVFNSSAIRHSALTNRLIKRVALCGGSGIGLLKQAIGQKADAFVTADIKYHNFFEPENRAIIIDIGHYESELFAIDIFYELLTKKIPNFAIQKSRLNSNPINYL
jgi:dinuclear metal center YbgI/SA1388 family protein